MRSKSMEEQVAWLNPKIQGWRNYYYTVYSQEKLAKLDWYILQRFTRWYAKKRQRKKMDEFISRSKVHDETPWIKDAFVICMPMNDEHRKAV
ncbi:group II intron maturase-specific domain-containing protein [Paenibacillus elgii]|uniref:group II intron maturase-specific domain-containing protein n=1 Tax=Paenibacillus elgii TaxID=189691 RepID=UPI002D7EC8F4|nr:group II intron maturase-specific domain-containing protein [Paenibacillus elgii]